MTSLFMGRRAGELLRFDGCADGGAHDGLGEAHGVARAAFLGEGADADFLALVSLPAGELGEFAL